ncbi:hypothetical protein ACSNOJ_05780 [Streptomyces sp. URMC 128]|uniref:hypothetical protein n=1 Tax=Streptomyces sp. URMC 128 TaxID=3423404 RepID=UPI003F1BE237
MVRRIHPEGADADDAIISEAVLRIPRRRVAADEERPLLTGVPDDVLFATKPQLAALLARHQRPRSAHLVPHQANVRPVDHGS